jgi:hypothetical protein
MMPARPEGLLRALGPLLAILFVIFLLPPLPSRANELSVLAGATESIDTGERSYAWQVACRYTFLRNFAASVSWINEGHLEEHKRDGFAVQGWGRVPFLDDRLSIGVGAGLYSFVDFEAPPGSGENRNLDIAGLLTITTSYRFSDHWSTRFHWNRVMSNDSRDTDLFLLGLGYRWER